MPQNFSKVRQGWVGISPLPAPLVFNAFDLEFDRPLAIPVVLYEITPQRSSGRSDSSAVNALWEHRAANRGHCSGPGFIVGVTDNVVAASQNWDLPSGSVAGFEITRKMAFSATSSTNNRTLILAVLRDAIKKHFKEVKSTSLGTLWPDYGDFCQMPTDDAEDSFSFCRKFLVRPKFLVDGRLVVQIETSTIVLDGATIATYYQRGAAHQIAELLKIARDRYSTRSGDPAKFRVWYDLRPTGRDDAKVIEIQRAEQLLAHAELSPADQRTLATSTISCIDYPNKVINVRLSHLRLIHGNWGTGGQHRKTILSPEERATLRNKVLDELDGFRVQGLHAKLNRLPVSAADYRTLNISPPAIQVRNDWDQAQILRAPQEFKVNLLLRRTRERSLAVGRNGYLRHNPIKPLLAWPREVGPGRRNHRTVSQEVVESMRKLLNDRFDVRKIDASFESCRYSNVDELRQYIEAGGFDSLFAVLPEASSQQYADDDTHEMIKQRIQVPSQCIHYDNTLAENVALKTPEELTREDNERVRRAVQQYDLCIDNLVVKCGWLPFLSADPFRFNVHVGIDVGGRNNDTVVVSLCHGLSNPQGEIAFRVQPVRVDTKQAEPIPTSSLAMGIREVIDYVNSELTKAHLPISFEDVLFFRDGAMLGKGDRWNEKDGLIRLAESMKSDGIIKGTGVWAIAESHKSSEAWRLEGNRDNVHENPVIGQCVVGFDQPDEALVCTTGQPFLSQGTAKPTIVKIHGIHGFVEMNSILKDYVWEADMGFTKMDVGHSLPWILRIADSGAYQLARSYSLSGITV